MNELNSQQSSYSEGESLNITQDLIEQLKQLVPQAFSEGKLDINQLKTLIGEGNTAESERMKIHCGEKHFEEFTDVSFAPVGSVADIKSS